MQSEEYYIKYEKFFVIKYEDENRFWNVVDGWVDDLKKATRYSKEEVDNYAYYLPILGEWKDFRTIKQ
jgi:hypothetical protein